MHNQEIKKGDILIAKPSLLTDVFHRSVVLIADHSQENGSVGFVLNKPIFVPLNDFIEDLNAMDSVYEGGPVDQENLFYLHKRPDIIKNAEHITKDLYWSGDFNDVRYAINHQLISETEIRFYLGYSGWSKNQLKTELENQAWHKIKTFDFNFFTAWDNNLWQILMKKLGGENLLWYNMPKNPTLN